MRRQLLAAEDDARLPFDFVAHRALVTKARRGKPVARGAFTIVVGRNAARNHSAPGYGSTNRPVTAAMAAPPHQQRSIEDEHDQDE